MHYQLFLPGVTTSDPKHLIEFGLDGVFGGEGNPTTLVLRHDSPTDKPGLLLNYTRMRDTDPHTAFFPKWNWRCIGQYWIGTNPKHPVQPLDLQRQTVYPGFGVQLKDGNFWNLPTYSRVEHAYGINEKGERVQMPVARFRGFFDRCLAVQQELFTSLDMLDILRVRAETGKTPENLSNAEIPVNIVDALGLVCMAMQINYRINEDIALALELFDQPITSITIANLIELPEIIATRDEKKNLGDAVVRVT